MKWANRVTKKRNDKPKEPQEREIDAETGLPKANVQAHRTMKPEDLSYDFLAKMGFVPPPPPPPWGFNKDGNSTAEIDERVMRCAISHLTCAVDQSYPLMQQRGHASLRRQLIPIMDLPTTMMCTLLLRSSSLRPYGKPHGHCLPKLRFPHSSCSLVDGVVRPTGDACGAIATQMAAKLKKADRINEKRFRVGKKISEYELLAVCCTCHTVRCIAGRCL